MWVGGIRMSMIATAGLYERTLSSSCSAFPGLADDLEARILEQPRDPFTQ